MAIFFTLLPSDVNFERIYKFEEGMILPQDTKKYFNEQYGPAYSLIPTIREELSQLILDKIQSQENLCCIFDDVLRSPTGKHNLNLFNICGLVCENEVYYLLEKNKISRDLIIQCLQASNAFWHSLCVITEAQLKDSVNEKISLKKIQEIGLKAKLIIIGAYDGEGYIFWEPRSKPVLKPNFQDNF